MITIPSVLGNYRESKNNVMVFTPRPRKSYRQPVRVLENSAKAVSLGKCFCRCNSQSRFVVAAQETCVLSRNPALRDQYLCVRPQCLNSEASLYNDCAAIR
ncbi:hypothetical protein PoB_002204500 [Plakobranchus ocellatus]|uniref:Uncharacterized protein n=1 Tax=Plakobranchus ocellatus TaxID=259542 RepID=A0AAV3ZIR9_9GAST|nr:hypothetical protein PoB_002204500 [Plakobranchus ocellatus]